METDSTNVNGEALSVATESCQGCRKRKLKCSRDVPLCSHCQRLNAPCTYDGKKNKPGLKIGAVESLSRRLEVLEDVVLRKEAVAHVDGLDNNAQSSNSTHGVPLDLVSTLASLCTELCKFNSRATLPSSLPVASIHTNSLPPLSPSTSSFSDNAEAQVRKRRRVDSCGNPNIRLRLSLEDLTDMSTALPSSQLLEHIINAYFVTFQPWIPIIHETRFRTRIHEGQQVSKLVVILHAMVVATIRFVDPEIHHMSSQEIDTTTQNSRKLVVLNGMDGLSLENLQALIIVAFNDIGNGDEFRAWSIIGSLTRTVEYLQLSVEQELTDEQPVFKPRMILKPASGWIEEEERRRVFWNVFNLDRFCSVLTGWNTSLTAEDVRRRLPADGGLWHKGEPVVTPYFGIWTRFEARMGNSIAFLPAHFASPEQNVESVIHGESPSPNTHGTRNSVQVDMSTVGAFAYCIEATESLSQVTSYFLQQKVNFNDRSQVSIWLTRFKELDLRLVHWKMFLPEKWRDSNISRQPTIVNMDPNLTLAHLTHNTSMILLHQRIAYPQSEWKRIVKLPSACSAETCQNAAVETQNIAEKYLRHSTGPVNNQFTFCVFIAATVLLVHWRYNDTELIHEFWLLIDCLDDMARRWLNNSISDGNQRLSLAGSFSERLRELHKRCLMEPDLPIDLLDYSSGFVRNDGGFASDAHAYQSQDQQSRTSVTHLELPAQPNASFQPHPTGVPLSPTSITARNFSVPDGMPLYSDHIAQAERRVAEEQMPVPGPQLTPGSMPTDELSNISYMLLDQSFIDLDRIITLNDMIFSAPIATNANMTVGLDQPLIISND